MSTMRGRLPNANAVTSRGPRSGPTRKRHSSDASSRSRKRLPGAFIAIRQSALCLLRGSASPASTGAHAASPRQKTEEKALLGSLEQPATHACSSVAFKPRFQPAYRHWGVPPPPDGRVRVDTESRHYEGRCLSSGQLAIHLHPRCGCLASRRRAAAAFRCL